MCWGETSFCTPPPWTHRAGIAIEQTELISVTSMLPRHNWYCRYYWYHWPYWLHRYNLHQWHFRASLTLPVSLTLLSSLKLPASLTLIASLTFLVARHYWHGIIGINSFTEVSSMTEIPEITGSTIYSHHWHFRHCVHNSLGPRQE